jgi:ribonuclease HI
MSIFCDGACKGNGQKGAVGGWAYAYWTGKAYGEPVTAGADRLEIGPKGEVPTNQRAELKALLEAVKFALHLDLMGITATIYTDSLYAMNCASKWGPSWKKAGWTRSSGEPLLNLDLVKPLVDLWNSKIKLQHVRGHQTNCSPEAAGNNWVDRAAVAGSLGVRLEASTSVSTSLPKGTSLLVSTSVPIPSKPLQSTEMESVLEFKPVRIVGQADIRSWFKS